MRHLRQIKVLQLLALLAIVSCQDNPQGSSGGDPIGTVAGTGGISSRSVSPAPTNFLLGEVTTSSVTFSWDDVASNEAAYEVEMCSGSECDEFEAISQSPLAVDSTSVTESGLDAGTTYRFRVRSTNKNGASAWLESDDIVTE
jgi:hypothetical protein